MADKNYLKGETSLLVLSLLSQEDKYGYQIIAELDKRSEHVFQLKEGTLYPILHALENDGAVKAYEKQTESSRVRRYYQITGKGRCRLAAEAKAWKHASRQMEKVLVECGVEV